MFFERALGLFAQAGIPVPVVSGGGTPALFTVEKFPMLTEHRAGTCVYNDVMVVASGTATWDDCAMRVRCHGREPADRDPGDPRRRAPRSSPPTSTAMKGYGHLLEYPEAVVTALSEEHGTVDLSACPEQPRVGDVVHVVPEPLLRRDEHGGRGLRGARRPGRDRLAGGGARPGPVGHAG